MKKLVATVGTARAGGLLPPRAQRVTLGGCTISGTVADLYPGGVARVIAWKLKGRDWLSAWVQHLFLNCLDDSFPKTSRLFGTDRGVEFAPLPDSAARLADLLAIFGEGARAPLPFFAGVSFTMVQAQMAGKESFSRDDWEKWESQDEYIALAFARAAEPLDAPWKALSLRILQPMFQHAKEVKSA